MGVRTGATGGVYGIPALHLLAVRFSGHQVRCGPRGRSRLGERAVIHKLVTGPYPHYISFLSARKLLMLDERFLELRGSSHYAGRVQSFLPRLLSRGEGRSPLEYIMSVFLLDFEYFFEKMFGFLTGVWVSILEGSKFLPEG